MAPYFLVQEGEMTEMKLGSCLVHKPPDNLPAYFISHFHILTYFQTSNWCHQREEQLPPPSPLESAVSDFGPVFHSVLFHMSTASYTFCVFQNFVRIFVPSPHYFFFLLMSFS